MSTALATTDEHAVDDKTLFSLVTDGDCRKLNDAQKLAYYKARCDAAGLDYRAQPFQFISLNGKLVLYALKACTDQLAGKHGIRCEIIDQRTDEGIRVVTVRATTKDGRATDEIGCVNVKGLQGENLCNALMKASTKAKRRAILAVCGLGMLDESEMDTVANARPAPDPVVQMPRRLSERPKPAEAAAVASAVNATTSGDQAGLALDQAIDDATLEPEPVPQDDDLVPVLQASLEAVAEPVIEEGQRKLLMKYARENGHAPEAVKRFLARRGFSSSKLVTQSAFAAIRDRLASNEPLEA